MGILNHYLFRTVAHDYGYYNFAFWDYSHFRISTIPSFNKSFLQDHFSFTLMCFVPVYWLFNWLTGTYTLIILQYSLVLIAAWYSYKTIQLKTNNLWLSAGVMVYYFVLLGRYTTFLCDVNLAVISSCFIPIFIYYFEVKKYYIALVVLILSLLSRENIPLWFIFIYAVLLIQHRKEKKAVVHSLVGAIISMVYFIFLFKVFIPAVESPDAGYALFNYSVLGSSPGEALSFIFQHPIESIKLFFVNHLDNPMYNGVKAEFYWVYLISGGFILFLRPQYLLWFIPIVAQKVLNDSYIRWGIGTYYSIEVVTLLPLSVFLALSSLKSKVLQNSLAMLACVTSIGITIHKLDRTNCRVPWLLDSSKIKFYSKNFYDAPFDIQKVNKVLRSIPSKARVSASNVLFPHLAQREHIYFFPMVKDAEYIVFSLTDNNYLFNPNENEQEREKYLNDPSWEIITKEFPVILLKRKDFSITNESSNIRFWNSIDTLTCNFEEVDFEKRHVLLSNIEKADTSNNLTSELSHSKNQSICLTSENPYSHSIKIKDIDRIGQIEISAWCHSIEDKGFIVLDGDNNFYQKSYKVDSTENNGWRKLTLKCWIPQNHIPLNISVYFWNPGSQPSYFDDLQIIKKYK